ALLETLPGRREADLARRAHVGGLRQPLAELRGERRHGEDRLSFRVGDDLRVHVLAAPVDREPRPFRRAPHPPAYPLATEHPRRFSFRRAHQRAAPAADLPAFRLIVSSAYLTPFPLYGSGGRSSRMA